MRRAIGFSLVAIMLCGCQTPAAPKYDLIASGTLLSVGKKNLVLQDKTSVLFVSIEAADHERLKDLKKGEKISLMGKHEVDTTDPKHTVSWTEIDELVRKDGSHIALGQ